MILVRDRNYSFFPEKRFITYLLLFFLNIFRASDSPIPVILNNDEGFEEERRKIMNNNNEFLKWKPGESY